MTKVPAPVKVKQEDEGVLHPLTFYIDDRVELIKQVFASLKPKTIKNLSPNFLKKQTLEEIEEKCLNELLGISSKRLRSIIQNTKCPSDTDSSDSDIDNVEAHISLEEISSDEGTKHKLNGKAKKLNKKKTKDSSKKEKNSEESESPDKTKTKKDLSVLELLELQARARAIRSQLALEPVTKVELDSDDEDEKEIPTPSTSKKVVLNRNFGRTTSTSELSEPVEKKQRSMSPDIVPILPNTETLFISDSEEEDTQNLTENNTKIDTEENIPESKTKPETETSKESSKNEAGSEHENSDRDDAISLGDVDIIDLDNSDDDIGNDEPDWNSRWLTSNKVSKVISSSKLGKKLRDKVKEKKSSEKKEKEELIERKKREHEEIVEKRKAADKIINSKEEGTLEQFRILKELEDSKSDKK